MANEGSTKPTYSERTFPIQRGTPIPWAIAEVAYRTYAAHYSGQSLERLAQRGGFGWHEFLHLYFGDADWKLTDAQVEERWSANALQKAESECSRLASRVEELEKDAFRWRLFYPADGTLGVYPAAAKGGSKPYEKRDDYMNGWNAACSAFLAAHSTIRKMVEELPAERREQLLSLEKAGIVWFSYEEDKRTVTLALNMNDTFHYACADAEDFPVEAIGDIHELYEKFSHDGVTAWAARQRKEVPIKECQTERYQEAVRWLAGAHAEEKPNG